MNTVDLKPEIQSIPELFLLDKLLIFLLVEAITRALLFSG